MKRICPTCSQPMVELFTSFKCDNPLCGKDSTQKKPTEFKGWDGVSSFTVTGNSTVTYSNSSNSPVVREYTYGVVGKLIRDCFMTLQERIDYGPPSIIDPYQPKCWNNFAKKWVPISFELLQNLAQIVRDY